MQDTVPSSTVEPLLFGPPDAQLYGCYHAPRGACRQTAILVCQPTGYESIRAHRCLRNLSHRLAGIGLPVLRFDYFGCGDSAGDMEDATLEAWCASIRLAFSFLQQRAAVDQVFVVGMRLGATLAATAQTVARGMVLWHPVQQGPTHLKEMRAMHDRHVARVTKEFGPPPARTGEEILGYRWPPDLLRELQAIDLLKLESSPAPRILLLDNDPQPGLPLPLPLQQHLASLGSSVDFARVPEVGIWEAEPYLAAMPQDSMQKIIAWLQERAL